MTCPHDGQAADSLNAAVAYSRPSDHPYARALFVGQCACGFRTDPCLSRVECWKALDAHRGYRKLGTGGKR